MFSRLLLLLLLLCAAATLPAALPPAGFLGIPWTATSEVIRSIMLKRPGIKLKSESATKLVFEGGTFADYPTESYEMELTDGKFTSGTARIVIPQGTHKDGAPLSNHQFEAFSKSLTFKYGNAVRSGDAKHTETTWIWPNGVKPGGQESAITILLLYSWDPANFIIRYSYVPGKAGPGK